MLKYTQKYNFFNFDRCNLTYGCSFFNTLAKRKKILNELPRAHW